MSKFDTDIAVIKSMQEHADARNHAVELYKHAIKALDDVDEHLREFDHFGLCGESKPRNSLKETIEDIDRTFWRNTFTRTGLTRIMDEQAINEFNKSLEDEPPAFSMDNITATFLEKAQNQDEMFARGVYNVFRQIHNWRGTYRTNTAQPFKIGHKVILEWWFELMWGGEGLQLRYSRRAVVNDIDRVLHVLDEKPFTPHSLESAINTHFKNWTTGNRAPFENEYMQIKGFKNGNAHILFKDEDLLHKVNKQIAFYVDGNALPDGRAA